MSGEQTNTSQQLPVMVSSPRVSSSKGGKGLVVDGAGVVSCTLQNPLPPIRRLDTLVFGIFYAILVATFFQGDFVYVPIPLPCLILSYLI
jgi:hypothetical protein